MCFRSRRTGDIMAVSDQDGRRRRREVVEEDES